MKKVSEKKKENVKINGEKTKDKKEMEVKRK